MSRIARCLISIVVSIPACHAGDGLFFSQSITIHATLISEEEVSVNVELLSVLSALSCESKERPTLVNLFSSVRMNEMSKALRSGRSLPWRRGFESHF